VQPDAGDPILAADRYTAAPAPRSRSYRPGSTGRRDQAVFLKKLFAGVSARADPRHADRLARRVPAGAAAAAAVVLAVQTHPARGRSIAPTHRHEQYTDAEHAFS
jgi:hypothetical protein